MASAFHAALLLPRGIRPTSSMILSPESDVTSPTSPTRRRKSKAESISKGVRRRLSLRGSSSTSKPDNKNKKKKKYYMYGNIDALPEQAPLIFYQALPNKTKKAAASPVLFWMERACPQDVVPKILAFCGPKTTATLYQCNRFWRNLIASEHTWRVMCEELYKWKEGDEEPSCSWREYYANNPCVPTDYSNLSDAVAAIRLSTTTNNSSKLPLAGGEEELPARTIWLRPQEHRLQESLLLQAAHANITLETMRTTKTTTKRRQPLASLLLQTRRRNKPLIHIAAGHVTLRKLRLGHYCGGFNLWNGNAAVQIQPITPPVDMDDDEPLALDTVLPSATLQEIEVISHSGRGVVINDGGNVSISRSYIHDCAATGIYVGSHSCQLTLEHSDLISNGHGNQLAASVRASGVSRGHSGFYLENGHAKLHQVNISNNSSCGISVSSAESRLLLDHSDVVANGHANQVEVAFGGGSQQQQHMGSSNNVARTGLVKVRSRLGLQSCCGRGVGGSSSGGRRSRHDISEREYHHHHHHHDEDIISEEEAEEDEDDMDHLQDSFVVAEENVRFGELIEI